MPCFKYGPKWGSYYSEREIDRNKVEKDAKALLGEVTKGEKWTNPHGVTHIPLLFDDGVVGHLWKDVDLKSVEIGAYWIGRFGIKVELISNNEVVGMLWLGE